MRILFISTMAGNPWGGSEELWCELALNAHNAGNKIFISYYDWGTTPVKIKLLEQQGIVSYKRNRISYSSLIQKPLGKFNEYMFSSRRLKEIMKKSDPEHIVVSMGGFSDLNIRIYRNFLLKTGTQFSLIVHVNPEDRYFSLESVKLITQICEKASKIYFVSKRLLEIAKRQTGYSFPNAEIILNPVNMDGNEYVSFPNDNEVIGLACVGRLNAPVKGQALLIQLLASTKWRERKWKLNIYGKGPDENLFKYLVYANNLEDKIVFHGHVKDIKKDIWAYNHVLVMPSYFEGLPLALVEAMLCGRTAVCTDVGGAKEILSEENGFFSDGVTLTSFGSAMENMWKEKTLLQKKGRLAKTEIDNYLNSFPTYDEIIRNLERK